MSPQSQSVLAIGAVDELIADLEAEITELRDLPITERALTTNNCTINGGGGTRATCCHTK